MFPKVRLFIKSNVTLAKYSEMQTFSHNLSIFMLRVLFYTSMHFYFYRAVNKEIEGNRSKCSRSKNISILAHRTNYHHIGSIASCQTIMPLFT